MSWTGADEPAASRQPAEHYSGEVWNEVVARGEPPSRLVVSRVTFTPGARTAWHSHPHGQVLLAESGVGRTQAAGEAMRELRPGDSVSVAPGLRHWHGAAPDQVFAHVAVQETNTEGNSAEWFSHVSDAEYASRAASRRDHGAIAAMASMAGATLSDPGIRDLELARARHALVYLKARLGNERMRALLAEDAAAMGARARAWLAESAGRWRPMSTDLSVPGCTARQFQRWYAEAVRTGRDDELLAGHPEHFLNHPDDGVVEVIENIGETELPWHVTYRPRPAAASWPIEWDEEFPVRFGASIHDNEGTLIGYSMRQARDLPGGLQLRVTALLPSAVPDEILTRHGRHLTIEYRNWIALAAG